MKKKSTEQVICMGCGDFFNRRQSIDVSPWGHCVMCKSKTLKEMLSYINKAKE